MRLEQQIHFLHKPFFIHPAIQSVTPLFEHFEQNKSLVLVKNSCDRLIILTQKRYSQVAWFHSTSIFQCLYFYFVLKCLAIYF